MKFLISGIRFSVLKKAQVKILNQTVCDSLMGGLLTPRMLCAGALKGVVNACQVTKLCVASIFFYILLLYFKCFVL